LNSQSLTASLKGLLTGLIFGILVSALPVLLIKHRKPIEFFTDQPSERWGLYGIVLIVSAAVFAKTFLHTTRSEIDQTTVSEANVVVHPMIALIKKYGFELIATTFLFWYTACAALCEKLRIFMLPDALRPVIYIFGLIFVALAAIVLLRSAFMKDTVPGIKMHPWTVAHPIYSASLIYIFGLPFLFQTWFPLVAIPGAIVCLKWELGPKSATTAGTSPKWQLIPFLY
jgi:hypothetical protein